MPEVIPNSPARMAKSDIAWGDLRTTGNPPPPDCSPDPKRHSRIQTRSCARSATTRHSLSGKASIEISDAHLQTLGHCFAFFSGEGHNSRCSCAAVPTLGAGEPQTFGVPLGVSRWHRKTLPRRLRLGILQPRVEPSRRSVDPTLPTHCATPHLL